MTNPRDDAPLPKIRSRPRERRRDAQGRESEIRVAAQHGRHGSHSRVVLPPSPQGSGARRRPDRLRASPRERGRRRRRRGQLPRARVSVAPGRLGSAHPPCSPHDRAPDGEGCERLHRSGARSPRSGGDRRRRRPLGAPSAGAGGRRPRPGRGGEARQLLRTAALAHPVGHRSHAPGPGQRRGLARHVGRPSIGTACGRPRRGSSWSSGSGRPTTSRPARRAWRWSSPSHLP